MVLKRQRSQRKPSCLRDTGGLPEWDTSRLARLLGVPTKGPAFELNSLHQSRVGDYQR